jgi:carbonic anhydrase
MKSEGRKKNYKEHSYKSSLNFHAFTFGVLLVSLLAPWVSFADEHNRSHWGYLGIEGPEHWALLTKEYATCETGSKQSPIDIPVQGLSHRQETLDFHYKASELHELNNGHTVQISHTTGCNVALNKHTYNLRQFHFHEPSEHHLDGIAFPMEMHLVHQDKTGHILVIAVMMEIGKEHPALKNIWDWLPDQIGKETSVPIQVSLREILPASTEHYSYSGSLTTPPCSEGVQWIVLTEPIKISEQSLKKFSAIIGDNARPVQPLGNRHIEKN